MVALKKNNLTFKITDHFLNSYDEIANVLWVLEDKKELTSNMSSIRKIGDWLNLVAHLKENNSINWKIADKLAMNKTIQSFVLRVDSCRANSSAYFEDAETWWPDLYELKRKGS